MSAHIIAKLKESDQDFEWYPTTDEILNRINSDLKLEYNTRDFNSITNELEYSNGRVNILDCGAGDGRSLKALSHGGNMYAIEKSSHLINSMPSDVFIVGTDFHYSTLIDKEVDVIFCNPPYSEFKDWALKIIKEANCKSIYLIIPERWNKSTEINDAIKRKDYKYSILGSFDFINADRSARAKVEIVKLKRQSQYKHVDPFGIWFDDTFKPDTKENEKKETLKDKIDNLVPGRGILSVLVELYNAEIAKLQGNFSAVCSLDSAILKELNVSVDGLKESLKQKIKGLKNKYWEEFFSNFDKITSRLTSKSRDKMLGKLNSNMSVDFTFDNAYAVTMWAIKNANKYYDSQLIDIFEGMIEKANVKLYKSNKRTFDNEDWRYCRTPEKLDRFSLELRIVLHRCGGLQQDGYFYSNKNGLQERAYIFIQDILTIANNLGFSFKNDMDSRRWESGSANEFILNSGKPLIRINAYKNGNLHIKFNKDFIRTLNVEFGRLKGWIKNKPQAMDEMDLSEKEVNKSWGQQFKLETSNTLLLCGE